MHPVPTGLASLCTHSTLIRIPKKEYAVKVGGFQWVRILPGQSVPFGLLHQRVNEPWFRSLRLLKVGNSHEFVVSMEAVVGKRSDQSASARVARDDVRVGSMCVKVKPNALNVTWNSEPRRWRNCPRSFY
jgi:hypothetical protein